MIRRKIILWAVSLAAPLIIAGCGILAVALMVAGSAAANKAGQDATTHDTSSAYGGTAGTSCAIVPTSISLAVIGPYSRSLPPAGPNDQLFNAAIIVSVGAARGLPLRDQEIALMAAMQESGLRNLDYGDRDSLGLFQMRPSMGWCTPDQCVDPYYAAGKFYDVLSGIPHSTMSLNDAAQAVERSGYPDAYGPHEQDALAVLNAIYSDAAATTCADVGTGMTQAQADEFMGVYKSDDIERDWDVHSCGCSPDCNSNCVSFSIYFVNRFTTSHVTGQTGNGRAVAGNMIRLYGLTDGGHIPRPYAVFSRSSGTDICSDGLPCGHTGVVLGIDEANNKIIIGEAGCDHPSFTGAHVYSLSDWETGDYTYAYTDMILKGDPYANL